jgi:orotate phosphoribosyltransferase
MNKESLNAEVFLSENEKVIFNKKIATETASMIISTSSYVVKYDQPKSEWIRMPDGKIIPCYCNCRYINRDPDSTKIIGSNFSSMIKDKYPEVQLIIGLETAGISWGSKIALDLGLPFAYARGKAKGYGTGKLIECNPPKGLKTVVVDDAFFSGESVDKAIEAIGSEIGGEILGVGFIANLNNLTHNSVYKQLQEKGIGFSVLTDYSYILSVLQEEHQIDRIQAHELTQFYNDPVSFSWS